MILTTILKWLGGDVLGKLTDTYVKLKSSAVESERIKADIVFKQIEAELASRKIAADIRLATAGFWEMRLITALIAACFTLHLLLVTLDTCFAFGWKIASFPAPFDQWEGAILLSFFGIYTVGKGISAVAGAITARGRP